MTTPARPNFFLLLELNPDEPWDQALYQKTIEEKVRQWSYESLSIAKKALPAQFYRGLLPQIRQVMEDPRLRAQEVRSASALLATRYQKEYQRFEEQLLLLNLKDAVDQEEIETFVKEFRHIVPTRTIERRITTRIRQSSQDDAGVERVLESSIAKNIEDHLAVVQVETLYELLHVSPEQSTAFLLQEAEKLYTQEVRQHPSAAVTARVELAGFAMMIFKTEEMRARYDETLRQVSLQQILEELTESARRSRVKEIHAGQVLYYIRKAEEMGMSWEKALERLKEHGRIHQWFIVIPDTYTQIQKRESEIDGEDEVSGATRMVAVQKVDEVRQERDAVVKRSIWRRIRAVLLVLVQLVFFVIVTHREATSMQPLLSWGQLAHVLLRVPSVPVARHVIETQFAFAAGNTIAHMLIAVAALFIVMLIDGLLFVFLLTFAIPLAFALVGLAVGGVSALRSVVETLFMAHTGMQRWKIGEVDVTRNSMRQKSVVLGSGWLMERLVAQNLAAALHRTGQRWSDFADLLGEWKWMRGCLIAYWAYPVKFGCQLAGLMHYVISIELDALCTCVYTVSLLIGEMAVLLGGGMFVVVRTLYMRLHHILES